MSPLVSLAVVVAIYIVLFVSFRLVADRPGREEGPTGLILGLGWGIGTFVGNWLLSLVGVLSFLPWIDNALHTFLWIGVGLTWLYLGVRFRHGLLVQCALFAGFSLVVKLAERLLRGTWEHDHFLWLIDGNVAYIVGWSLLDGLYPVLSLLFLRWLAQRATRLPLVVR